MTDKYEPNEKSAGQLLYEKKVEEVGVVVAVPWKELSGRAQHRYEFNATVTPKNQTIKSP